jgi:nitroreductase
MSDLPDPLRFRQPDHLIEPLLLKRWSPRAMSGKGVAEEHLARLFEAARWAPSTYNEQEWRFLYAHREATDWNTFLHLLVDANQVWCANAGVLVVVLSHQVFARNGKPNPVHSLDTGMAVENLLLQAAAMGLVAHPMAGFDRDRTRQELGIPDDYTVECMIAVGHPGLISQLPDGYRDADRQPTSRKPIADIATPGRFQ